MYSIQRTTCSEGSHHFQDLFPHLGSVTGKWGLPWKIVAPCCRSKILGIIPSPFKPRCRLASSGDKLVCVERGHELYDNPPQGSYEMPRDWKEGTVMSADQKAEINNRLKISILEFNHPHMTRLWFIPKIKWAGSLKLTNLCQES